MKKQWGHLALALLTSIASAHATAQQSVLYPDTSLTACPEPNQVLGYFYYHLDRPEAHAGSWCGAAQASIDLANIEDPIRARVPYLLEECHAGQYWRYSHACGPGSTCSGPGRYQSPPVRGISMLCYVDVESPDNPPLGCATGAGGFSRCLPDSGVLPSRTPPGTPVGGGLNPNAGAPAEDMEAPPAPSPLVQADGPNHICPALPPSAESVGNPIFGGTGNKYQEELDYATASGLRLARHYNSSTPGWMHSFGMRVLTRETQAVVIRPTGRAYSFAGAGPGEWAGEPSARDRLVRLDAPDPSAPMWRYLVADGTTEEYDSQGRILRIVRRGGHEFGAAHALDLLRTVTDPFGRRLAFEYDADNRLQRVTTPEGSFIQYGYDEAGRLALVSYPDGMHRRYLYENAAYPLALTGIVDERGVRYATWSYDTQGRAVLSERAGGTQQHRLEFAPDGSVRVIDPLGTARMQRYGAAGARRVFTGQDQPCADCRGDAAERVVDATTGLVLQSQDFLGVNTSFAYDARKLPSVITQAQGRPEQRQVQMEWHPTHRLPVRIAEPGRTTVFDYDDAGRALGETITDTASGHQRTWLWTYNAQGLLETMRDSRGSLWRYNHDERGNRISMIDPRGQETRYTFDPAGKMLTESSPGRPVRAFTWDVRQRLVAVAQGDEVVRYAYTPTGQLAAMEQPDGYRIEYAYDQAQRLVGAADNRGARIQYSLDAAGHTVREEVRDPRGQLARVTTRIINALGRVAALQRAAGQTMTLDYDANGDHISTTDPLLHTARQTLDGLRRTTAITLPDNAAAAQAWDALDRLVRVTDPKGVATQYTRNAFGEVMSETSPDIGTMRYTHDAAGEVVGIEDARGQVTTISRDELGRPTEIRHASDHVALLRYDSAGDLIGMDDPSGSTRYQRDSHGRITAKVQAVNDNPANPSRHTLTYSYAQSRLAGVTYPTGLRVQYRRSSGRIHGIDVQLPDAHGPIGFVTDIEYTALGQPHDWRWISGVLATRTFDTDGRMTNNEFGSYVRDAAGRITAITQTLWARSSDAAGRETYTPVPLTWMVGYDVRDRVIRFERVGGSVRYGYDANGNRLTAVERATSEGDLEGEFDASDLARKTDQAMDIDASSNRLLGLAQTTELTRGGRTISIAGATVTYTLDANGSLTSDGLRSFEYDAANRLAKVGTRQQDEAMSLRYLHNAASQRVFKSEPQADYAQPDSEVLGDGFVGWLRRRFGWMFTPAQVPSSLGVAYVHGDGELPSWALLGEYDNGTAKGRGSTEYIWLPLEDGSAIPVGMFRGGKLYAVHTDHLGTPRMVKDDQRRPVWQWPYSAFGDNKPTGPLVAGRKLPSQLSATEPIEFGLRFPGQFEDADAGLNYNLFRWYHAKGGRFTQADRIGLAGGLNRFPYGDNNSISRTDPDGRLWLYQQSTGNLYHQPTNPSSATLVATGYAGNGSNLNSPLGQSVPNSGPLPQGDYSFGPQRNSLRTGRGVMDLIPDPTNLMFNRSAFQMHGDNGQGNRTASDGCIIMPRSVRDLIGNGSDKRLRVIP